MIFGFSNDIIIFVKGVVAQSYLGNCQHRERNLWLFLIGETGINQDRATQKSPEQLSLIVVGFLFFIKRL